MGSFSVWHWVIVFGFVGAVTFGVVRSRRPKAVTTSGTVTTSLAKMEPNGLGGWLIVMVLGQVGGIGRILKGITEDIDFLETPNLNRAGEAAIYVELGLNVAMLALVALTTVAMFRKLRAFPSLWMWQGVTAILMPLLDAVLIARILNIQIGDAFDEKSVGQLIAVAITVGIWTWYLKVSVRVRNTFVN